jgi:hypothetical protein
MHAPGGIRTRSPSTQSAAVSSAKRSGCIELWFYILFCMVAKRGLLHLGRSLGWENWGGGKEGAGRQEKGGRKPHDLADEMMEEGGVGGG